MRAILLSGGRGERLRPLTDRVQKVMIPLNGKPLLQYWVELLKKYDIKDIAMNISYLGEQIIDYFGDGKKLGINISYSEEETLLGTATPIKRIDRIYPHFCSEPFFVIYADNLSDINLEKVISAHKENSPIATLTLHNHSDPWTKGIVNIDNKGKVLGFVEKPKKEDLISGRIRGEPASCVYLFEPGILEYINDTKEDLGAEVFPRLLKRGCSLYAFNPKAYVQDIGTFEGYEQAKRDVTEFPERFNFKTISK